VTADLGCRNGVAAASFTGLGQQACCLEVWILRRCKCSSENHSLRFLLQTAVFLWRHFGKPLNESYNVPDFVVIVNLAV
jgi:hypothetical protein